MEAARPQRVGELEGVAGAADVQRLVGGVVGGHVVDRGEVEEVVDRRRGARSTQSSSTPRRVRRRGRRRPGRPGRCPRPGPGHSIRSSDDSRQSTKIVPSRWSTSSWTRCRPMNPVAPVTKYAMARTVTGGSPQLGQGRRCVVEPSCLGLSLSSKPRLLAAEHDLVPARDRGPAAGLLDRAARAGSGRLGRRSAVRRRGRPRRRPPSTARSRRRPGWSSRKASIGSSVDAEASSPQRELVASSPGRHGREAADAGAGSVGSAGSATGSATLADQPAGVVVVEDHEVAGLVEGELGHAVAPWTAYGRSASSGRPRGARRPRRRPRGRRCGRAGGR